jgi:hypothetical protein
LRELLPDLRRLAVIANVGYVNRSGFAGGSNS